jgi:hypothetical protein
MRCGRTTIKHGNDERRLIEGDVVHDAPVHELRVIAGNAVEIERVRQVKLADVDIEPKRRTPEATLMAASSTTRMAISGLSIDSGRTSIS